ESWIFLGGERGLRGSSDLQSVPRRRCLPVALPPGIDPAPLNLVIRADEPVRQCGLGRIRGPTDDYKKRRLFASTESGVGATLCRLRGVLRGVPRPLGGRAGPCRAVSGDSAGSFRATSRRYC